MKVQSLHLTPGKPLRLLAVLLLLSSVFFCFDLAGRASGSTLSGKHPAGIADGDKIWLVVKVSERRLELVGNYSYRMNGSGRVNFKEGGRIVELPEGLTILVNDKRAEGEQRVNEDESVRVVNSKGETLWIMSAVRNQEGAW